MLNMNSQQQALNTIDATSYGSRPRKDYISMVTGELDQNSMGGDDLNVHRDEINLPMTNNHHTIGYTEPYQNQKD